MPRAAFGEAAGVLIEVSRVAGKERAGQGGLALASRYLPMFFPRAFSGKTDF
jgi:hypothetical protein